MEPGLWFVRNSSYKAAKNRLANEVGQTRQGRIEAHYRDHRDGDYWPDGQICQSRCIALILEYNYEDS